MTKPTEVQPQRREFGWLALYRRRLLRGAAILGVGVALTWLSGVRLFAFSGDSMVPTVMPGDHFIGCVGLWGLSEPQRFDMVIFDVPATSKWAGQKIPWMKRLVALPGEHVRLAGGQLFINGRKVDAPFLYSHRNSAAREFELTLSSGEYWVLGDNLDSTLEDSRALGPIPHTLMKGYVAFVIRTAPRSSE